MPEAILLEERLNLHKESVPGYCGIAAIRSVLDTQFQLQTNEDEVLSSVCAYFQKRNHARDPILQFRKYGTPAKAMAYALRSFLDEPVKIFCSRRGTIPALHYFLHEQQALPILYQVVSYPYDPTPEGHYLLYCGQQERASPPHVLLFDPSPKEGLKEISQGRLNQEWLYFDERWYAVVLSAKTKVPGFSGRFL